MWNYISSLFNRLPKTKNTEHTISENEKVTLIQENHDITHLFHEQLEDLDEKVSKHLKGVKIIAVKEADKDTYFTKVDDIINAAFKKAEESNPYKEFKDIANDLREVINDEVKKVPSIAVKLVKKFEGFRDSIYKCSAGIPTIGYGTTTIDIIKQYENQSISHEKAEELLVEHLAELQEKIEKLVTTKLTDDQLGSLLSFVYNVGIKAFERSTLRKLINASAPLDEIEREFLKFKFFTNNGKKQASVGLLNRRIKEAKVFAGKNAGNTFV